MKEGGCITFPPMVGYIVSFHAPNPYPRKFTYLACTELLDSNMRCMKSVEGPQKCEHGSMQLGSYMDQYRFDVFFVDDGIGVKCPPLRATVFDAGRALLENRNADVFRFMREGAQIALVRRVIDNLPLVEIIVRVSAGKATIQRLKVLRMNNSSPHRPLRSTSRSACSQQDTSVADSTPAPAEAPARTTEVPECPWSPSSVAYNSLVAEVESLKSTVTEMEFVLRSLDTE